ncbi:PDZ domain (Also known as DHR or GLGF) family protein [Acanthocheilonema viteae]
MALKLDTSMSSMNGSNNDSNGNSTGGMIFKTNSNHSPSSNDSGFHSDRLQQYQQSRQSQRTISRNRGNIKHKPTYVSVFASDPDCSSPLFDEFNRRFAANRPNFLNGTLSPPTGDEEIRSVPSITAPLITPSRQSISPSFINTNVSSDTVIHPETSKQTYLNKQQSLLTSSLQHEQHFQSSHSSTHPETAVHQNLHDTATPSNIPSFNGISNSNQSMQEILAQKSYKYARLKNETEENTAYISEQDEKSEAPTRELPNNFYSKFPENLPTEGEISNYPPIAAKSEEVYVTLSKLTDLPITKLPRDNEIMETSGQNENGKLCDDKLIVKQSSAYEICHLSSDFVTEMLPESVPSELGNASPQQSLMRPEETPMSRLLTDKIVPKNDEESYGSANLEEPPLQVLSRNLEFEMISQRKTKNITLLEKPENRLMKAKQHSDYHENLNSLENSSTKAKDISKAEAYSDMGRSRFVSFVPATKLNQITSQRLYTLRNLNGNEKSTSAMFEKSDSIVSTKSIQENSVLSTSRKPEHSRGIDRIVFTNNELQTTTSSNEKFEKPVAPIAPRRARDDDKPVPFNKLIEKFTKADNGAIPTPKAFQCISSSSKSTTLRNNSSCSSNVSKTATPNRYTSKKIPYDGGNRIISEKFTERNSTTTETSKNKFSTVNSASISQVGNSFAKARASFEKNAEFLPVISGSHKTEKKFISAIEEKSSNIIQQYEKVEKKSSIITKEKEKESSEVCSSMMEKVTNTNMYPSILETESSVTVMKGLDFSRFDHIADNEVIGRPLEADEAEQTALQIIKEVTSNSELHAREQPSEVELMECKSLLDEKFADYDIFKVILKRSANNPEGSIGVILSSAASGDQYISVQRVISGSIADRSDLIEKGDRVFFVQGHSTKQMSATDARTLVKQRTEHVVFILGRLKTKSNDMQTEPTKFVSIATADPHLFNYSTDSEEVILTKGNLGVGLALDGGRGSVFGDRPIVIKRVFEGGSAARSGRIKVGDQVITIDGIDVKGMSYLEATKTLRSRPEGPLKLVILRRL